MMKTLKSSLKVAHIAIDEKGNALIIILVAIVLFGALSFTVARSMNSSSTTAMSERELVLIATGIIDYSQEVERAVSKLRRKGCSENDISFWFDSNGDGTEDGSDDYYNANSPSDRSCHVFQIEGGNVNRKTAENLIPNFTRSFIINGNNTIATYGCDTINDASCSELVMSLRLNEIPELCLMINDRLGTENPSDDAPRLRDWSTGSPFTGTFTAPNNLLVGGTDATDEAPQVNGKPGACVFEFSSSQDNHQYYYVLIGR